jgi:hypothetical protein
MIHNEINPPKRLEQSKGTHPFESALAVVAEDIEIELRGRHSVPWYDFILNPRRLRGSDFLMRWSQGVWSEERLIQAVNETDNYFALPYGPSSVAPDNDVRAFELYFERLDKAGLGDLKRPDLLIFRKSDKPIVMKAVEQMGSVLELPFTSEEDKPMGELLARAVLAVECENSLWQTSLMPDYGAELKPMSRLGGKLGLSKGAVVPTIILKKEDSAPLRKWQKQRSIGIHIWHVFFDRAFGIAFDRVERLINRGLVEPTEQTYQAPGGATTRKTIYKVYYHYGYPLGEAKEEPSLTADCIKDKNGHILPYVKFSWGSFEISEEALQVLEQASLRENIQ